MFSLVPDSIFFPDAFNLLNKKIFFVFKISKSKYIDRISLKIDLNS